MGTGSKVFSSGLNLKMQLKDNTFIMRVASVFNNLLLRLTIIGLPTLAVVNGHNVAGGVFLSFAHDRIIMNSNPKFMIFVNELLNGLEVPMGFSAITKAKNTP